jgi:adenylate cyclase
LLEVTRRVSDSLSLDVLLPRMVELISELLDAERCTIFLHDPEGNRLYTKAAMGLESELQISAEQGIAGAVFQSGEPICLDDPYADARFEPQVDKRTGFRTRSMLCAPIKRVVEGRVEIVGVTQVLNKRGARFRADDVQLLETLTGQAASAFVNAQRHEQVTRAQAEERQLLELTAAIATEIQLEPLLRKIMETVSTILRAERATLFMHDAKSDELWALISRDAGMRRVRLRSDQGIAGAVFTSGETINIPDAYADPRFNRDIDRRTQFRTRNVLCMPVADREGRIIGVTQVLNKHDGRFDDTDERRLRTFSAQASIAIGNARLFDEVVRMKNYNEGILESLTSGVITVDPAGRIVKANAATRVLLGPELDVSGVDLRACLLGEGDGRNEWVVEMVDRVRRTGEPSVTMDADLQIPRSGTALPVNISVFPLPAEIASIDARDAPAVGERGAVLMFEDITKEKRLRTTMARYMTKELADKLLEEGEAALGGKTQKASVLFTDIRSFTSLAESAGPQETVKLLNAYFTTMVDVILEHGGILDKYIGDAIMAVFGVPFTSSGDADNAVTASIGMLRALRAFNGRRVQAGQAAVEMGLGIATDEVLSGNIGSLKRMDYTVIGDGVNLASRLESANKLYGTQVLISERTVRDLVKSYRMREVDCIRVKGKDHPVAIYEVFEHLEAHDLARLETGLHDFEKGLESYRQGDWTAARASFEKALRARPEDGPSRLLRDRCSHLMAQPPEDWNGVWVMTEK